MTSHIQLFLFLNEVHYRPRGGASLEILKQILCQFYCKSWSGDLQCEHFIQCLFFRNVSRAKLCFITVGVRGNPTFAPLPYLYVLSSLITFYCENAPVSEQLKCCQIKMPLLCNHCLLFRVLNAKNPPHLLSQRSNCPSAGECRK